MKPPFSARHIEPTWVSSIDDELTKPSERLIELSLKAIEAANKVDLKSVSDRIRGGAIRYPDIWPGEHYKLLAGLVRTLKPKTIIEIGTSTGLSALSMRAVADSETQICTFDLIRWDSFADTSLEEEDFSPKFVQYLDDLSTFPGFIKHKSLLEKADLIFVDAAKDGQTEPNIIQNFLTIRFSSNPIVVFDDIKLTNMLAVWRRMPKPKLDLTSFGHWSGTGIVDWTE